LTLEFFKKLSKVAANEQEDQAPAEVPPLRLTFITHIKHGPLPGFSTFAAASSKTEIIMPDEVKEDMAELLGDKKLITEHTTICFDGSIQMEFFSPQIAFTLPTKEANSSETMTINWEGLEGKLDLSSDTKRLTFSGKAPALRISSSDGEEISLKGMRFEGDTEKTFDDLSVFFAGNQSILVDEVVITIPEEDFKHLAIKKLNYDIKAPVTGEFFDIVERFGIESVQIGKDKLGPFHLDVSFKHLHARSLAEISQSFVSLQTDPDVLAGNDQAFVAKLIPILQKNAETIFLNEPEIHFDRLSLANIDGESKLTGHIKLKELNIEEVMANPAIILTKLEAIGDLSLHEEMVLGVLRNPPVKKKLEMTENSTETPDPELQMRVDMFQQQVAMFSEMGYIDRDGGLLKTHVELNEGQLLVNGKSFMPMGGPSTRQAEPGIQ
jgi:uncharacterized protein YdgA (DUF945 family)